MPIPPSLVLLGLLSTLALSWTMDPTWNLTTLDAVGNVITLHNASDFIELSNIMKREVLTDFAGSTIVLDSDIDFTNYSDQFEPIGRNYYTLRAKFDGRGHTISNLHLVSNWRFVSIFAMINGTSFKNLVVDASCTIHSNHYYLGNNYTGYVAGIIGYMWPDKKDSDSIVENLVNMARASFSGGIGPESTVDTSYTFVGGGVIGYFKPRRTDTIIRNCVNFGEVSFTGKAIVTSLGGVLGAFLDISNTVSTYLTMENCVNYGNLVHTGETSDMLGLGGLTGAAFRGIVKRCMNFGSIIANRETAAGGQIVGGGTEKLTIKDCVWAQEKVIDYACGYTYTGIDVVISSARRVVFDEKELTGLNDWVDSANDEGDIDEEEIYHRWMALHLDGGSVGNASGALLPAMIGYPIMDPTKEGHTFLHWCMDSDCTDGPATKEDVLNETTTELYAKWSVNSYIAQFIMNNGTIIEKVFTYNEAIVPPDMTGVKDFHGWDIPYSSMPASDIMIFPSNPPRELNAGAIAGGVVGGIAGVAIIVLVIFFIVLRKTKIEEREMEMDRMNDDMNAFSRIIVTLEMIDDPSTIILSSEVEENPSEYLDLYSGYFKAPSISEALIQAGLDRDKAKCVERYCMNAAKRAESEGALSPAFTLGDAAAVALYTYDFGPGYFESNPYMLLNTALASRDSAGMQSVRGLLYVVMCALRKLPRYSGKTLYRGMKMSIDKNAYVRGRVIVWRRLTSTTTDMKTVKSFLDSSMEHDKSTGTLFVIEGGWGYNLQPYSLFPDEEEVLLEPKRQFVVESVIESDVTIVNLKMLDTPLVLPEVFGDGNK